ncbi:sodium-dependent transporter [Flagellatimonas centrodinii]|uniref:sodium-dependent transporter n=1 Tax=Flagellatimonas centrodinii TaxID=2806210 RepID=UPI001FED5463|nr:sodium-dependent transporter [Flagellatimonas centrodinii]ULQ46415.1 sodium-dependent transporter [Flagellatimonas centrodinii]
MDIRESRFGTWQSTRAFVWVAVGACVGIGNLVRLPSLLDANGGVWFLALYGVAMLVLGLPLLVAEWALGRWMREDLVTGLRHLAEAAGARAAWAWLGGLMVGSAALILSYYSVMAGWSLGYVFRAAAGGLGGISPAALTETFLQLAREPERGLAWHTIFMVMACIVVAHGFREGIERIALRVIPLALLTALLLLAWLVWRLPGDSLLAWLAPSAPTAGWLVAGLRALQEAFVTLSLGVGVMITLGSYLPTRTPLVRTALAVISLDLLFSLILGGALFLMLGAASVPPARGLGLIFQSLPSALPVGVEGAIVGVAFYGLALTLTLASGVALLEPVTRYAMERWRVTRVFAATSSSVVIWAFGVLTLLSFHGDTPLRFAGVTVFEALQFMTAQVAAPVAGLLLCVFCGRIIPRELARAAYGEGRGFAAWSFCLRYPARLGLLVLLLQALGVMEKLIGLWQLP